MHQHAHTDGIIQPVSNLPRPIPADLQAPAYWPKLLLKQHKQPFIRRSTRYKAHEEPLEQFGRRKGTWSCATTTTTPISQMAREAEGKQGKERGITTQYSRRDKASVNPNHKIGRSLSHLPTWTNHDAGAT